MVKNVDLRSQTVLDSYSIPCSSLWCNPEQVALTHCAHFLTSKVERTLMSTSVMFSVAPRPAASASHRNLFEMQMISSYFRRLGSETLGAGLESVLTRPSGVLVHTEV